MLKSLDRIKELCSTVGTGNLALTGAESGFQAFSVLGNGTKCYYTITDVNTIDFEVGEGIYNAGTLSRDTIFESSNSGNKISLSATGSTVFVTYPAEKSSYRDIGVNRDYTASGSITAGKPLILNADNTVSQVAETPSTIPAGLGTNSSIAISSSVYDQQVSMGATNQFISLYTFSNDTKCYLTPNTISSDLKTITSGVETNFDTGNERNTGIIYEPNQGKYVAFYLDGLSGSNYYPCARVLEFVGTGATATISFGTPTILDSNSAQNGFDDNKLTYDTTAEKIILSFARSNSSGWTISTSLSGSTITAGTPIAVPMYGSYLNAGNITCSYSSTEDKTVYLYADNNTEDLYTTVGTVSGSSFSFGSTAIVGSLPTGNFNGADACVGVDNNGVVVLSYLAQDIAVSYTLFSQAGTLSGTTITWGSPSQVSNVTCINNAQNECSIESIASGKMIITRATRTDSPSNADEGIFVIVTSSGTTVTNGSVQTFSTSATRYPSVSTNYSKTQAVINYGDASSMDVNNIIYLESQQTGGAVTNLTSDNYFGVASSTASTTEPVGVNRAGSFNNDQTGMTTGKDMYVTDAGLIKERTTTSTTANTTPTVTSPNNDTTYTYTDYADLQYDSASSYYFKTYKAQNNSGYATIRTGTWDSTNKNIAWTTPQVLASYSTRGEGVFGASGDGIVQVLSSLVNAGNDYIKLFSGVINSSDGSYNNSNINIDSASSSTNNYMYPHGITYHETANRFIFVWAKGNYPDQTIYVNTAYKDTSSPTGNPVFSGATSEIVISSGNSSYNTTKGFNLGYDPDTDRSVYIYRKDIGSFTYKPSGCVIGVSGTTITVGSDTLLNSPMYGDEAIASAYDTQNDKYLIVFRGTTGSYPPASYSNLTITGGATNSISYGTVGDLTTYGNENHAITFDQTNNQFIAFLRDNSNSNVGNIVTFTSDGTALTEVATVTDASNPYNLTTVISWGATWVSGNGASFTFKADGSSNMTDFSVYFGSSTSTVVNGSQFVGTARSGTDLELAETPTELVGYSESAITKGRAVVVKPDGNYAQAGLTTTSVTNTGTASQGSLGNIGTYSSDMFAMAVASDGVTYCFTYQNTSTQQACKIGTRSGETISWGSELVLASVNSDSHFVSYNEEANVFLTTYTTGNTVKGTAVSFSGNTGTKGTEVTIMDLGGPSSSPSYNYKHWYDSTNKVTVCWAVGGVSGNATNRSSAVVLTLTGTSISVGTLYENSSAGGDKSTGCDITGGKHVLYWNNSSGYPSTMTMTVTSSGAISWGTALVINSASGSFANPIYNPTYPNKAILAGKISTANNYFSYAGLTISGTSITASNYSDGNINNAQSYVESGGNVAVYSNYSGNYCFVYQTYSPYNSRYNFATTTDGLSLTVATAVTTTAHGSNQFYAGVCASDVDGVFVENHNDRSSSPGYYSYYCFNPTFSFTLTTTAPNMTSANVIGIAQETILANNDIKVKTFGQVDENQSSLTTGSAYFVNGTTGAIQTTADDPSVNIGTALNSTNLLIKS